ncbi:hypothetical protein CDD83_8459 [Cordyceps sp. RAO-2017]|nr:hypothetical protein CDD83_8459 [Cordyceps sp. RAO-2017]
MSASAGDRCGSPAAELVEGRKPGLATGLTTSGSYLVADYEDSHALTFFQSRRGAGSAIPSVRRANRTCLASAVPPPRDMVRGEKRSAYVRFSLLEQPGIDVIERCRKQQGGKATVADGNPPDVPLIQGHDMFWAAVPRPLPLSALRICPGLARCRGNIELRGKERS